MRELIRSAFAPLSDWSFVALHLAGNALLLAAATFWLLIPEAHVWQLIAAAVSGVVILFAFAWLHCGTLAHGITPVRESRGVDFRRSVRHIPLVAILFAVLVLLMRYADAWSEKSWEISGYFYTWLPKFLQNAIGEYRFNQWVDIKFAILIWFVLPALFLPLVSAASSFGLSKRGFGAALRTYARWKYWLGAAILAVIGIWVPHLMMGWLPGEGLRVETISLVLRLLVAYTLTVVAWLMASALVGSFLRPAIALDAFENSGGDATGKPAK